MNLTTPSTTQVYSPFGSFVVERHDEGADLSLGRDEWEYSGPPDGAESTPKSNNTH